MADILCIPSARAREGTNARRRDAFACFAETTSLSFARRCEEREGSRSGSFPRPRRNSDCSAASEETFPEYARFRFLRQRSPTRGSRGKGEGGRETQSRNGYLIHGVFSVGSDTRGF